MSVKTMEVESCQAKARERGYATEALEELWKVLDVILRETGSI